MQSDKQCFICKCRYGKYQHQKTKVYHINDTIPIYLVYHTFIYKILFSFKSTHRSFHRRKLKYIYQKKVFVAIINNKWVRGLYSWFGENSAPESKIAWLDIDRTAIKFFQNKKLVCC